MAETTPTDVARIDYAVREHRSLWVDSWRQLISSRTAKAGLLIITVLILSTVLAHYFWEYNPKTDLDYTLKLKPPTLIPNEEVPSVHIYGTDKLGRDIFRRVVHGGWNTLRVGVIAVTISLFIGGLLGLLAGFFESIEMNRLEKIVLLVFLGGLMGFIPAWIAEQPVQLVLFALLGAAAAIFEKLLAGKPARVILFGAQTGPTAALLTRYAIRSSAGTATRSRRKSSRPAMSWERNALSVMSSTQENPILPFTDIRTPKVPFCMLRQRPFR